MTDQSAKIADLISGETREKVLSSAIAKLTVEYNKNPDRQTLSNLQAAQKALDEARAGKALAEGGLRFPTQTAALEYLQRKYQIEKSKLSKDVNAGRVPKKDGMFHAKDLDFYATAVNLKPKNIEQKPADDQAARLKKAMADEREFRVGILQGKYVDAAEEEARDARLWYAIRTDIENLGPGVISELVNRIAGLALPEEHQLRIAALVPELRHTFEDSLAEIFDRYAQQGGIEA